MSAPLVFLTALQHCFLTACIAFFDLGRLLLLAVRPRAASAAKDLLQFPEAGDLARPAETFVLSMRAPAALLLSPPHL